MDKMKRVNITISEVHIKMLKVLSKKHGLTVSDVIRRAIEKCFGELKSNERRKP